MPEPERTIRIEVAWALPERQLLIALEVPDGTTVRDAVVRAGIDPAPAKFGLFGKVVAAEHALRGVALRGGAGKDGNVGSHRGIARFAARGEDR